MANSLICGFDARFRNPGFPTLSISAGGAIIMARIRPDRPSPHQPAALRCRFRKASLYCGGRPGFWPLEKLGRLFRFGTDPDHVRQVHQIDRLLTAQADIPGCLKKAPLC